jgi:cobalt-zinc-cadmium efflux system protein
MPKNSSEKSLIIAILLTSTFFVVEVIGGFLSGSLSLLGDAGHMFRDVFALLLSLSAVKIAKKLPTKTKTFGYHRLEIFAAFLNGLMLIGISCWIFWEAYHRFVAPKPVRSIAMFIVALIGLLVNLYIARRLHGNQDLNIKSAFLHVLTDTISSAAVIFASIWIFFTKQIIIDPIMSVGIAFFVLISALPIIKDTMRILLEFTPKDIDLDEVIADIEKVNGVEGVHNVHLWSLCSNVNIIDAHIFAKETDMLKIEEMKHEIKRKLEKYNIKHATLEFECEECRINLTVKELEH